MSALTSAQLDGVMQTTLNQMGWSVEIVDPYTGIFLKRMHGARQPVADLGCGFGIVTEHLLADGATVIANDIAPAHLEEVKRRIPDEQRANLTLVARDATQLDFPADSLVGIMAGRWVHFLTSPAFREFFQKAYTWLASGGTLCVTVHAMKAWCAPDVCREYEKNRESGMEWPGWSANWLEDAGFLVEKAGLYDLMIPSYPASYRSYLASQNTIGVVAIKPFR
ncbi:uncharacterized protein LOC129599722 [Paramacrobiotus metropolitanus]|uniref:uncharacterized protein LOC129599722 n=1 Tax=Paramacrobiotus metropolitanus TaxID=2943436 RepID=UPI002445BC97|nr:uncharacterized protein LOC129599722 [Paramacrobiotus metropolitanus]